MHRLALLLSLGFVAAHASADALEDTAVAKLSSYFEAAHALKASDVPKDLTLTGVFGQTYYHPDQAPVALYDGTSATLKLHGALDALTSLAFVDLDAQSVIAKRLLDGKTGELQDEEGLLDSTWKTVLRKYEDPQTHVSFYVLKEGLCDTRPESPEDRFYAVTYFVESPAGGFAALAKPAAHASTVDKDAAECLAKGAPVNPPTPPFQHRYCDELATPNACNQAGCRWTVIPNPDQNNPTPLREYCAGG